MDKLFSSQMQLAQVWSIMSSFEVHSIPGVTRGMPKRELFQFPGDALPGLPKGGLVGIHGVSGAGKTELVLKFLAANPGVSVAWIEETFSAYPCAFPQFGVGLDRILFVELAGSRSAAADSQLARVEARRAYKEDPLWVVHQIIKSQAFGIVVLC